MILNIARAVKGQGKVNVQLVITVPRNQKNVQNK